ncbi:DEAD/DEAH box helicase [Opitutus terrae]|uniref:DEAD/DEAH box helicase domain protein n=1 Tax=Opitutus terrae (strain DSM 11246 / JCM 15787 / PB90-1) TaxID=452637 RepID=B1ZRH1_OPITP|nr:DEAD/DEAH box helicase [Opitutus terrae]ACB77621.1 DEAD/DEAH box helicase domain protein [Opitutus terrae PB90-1]
MLANAFECLQKLTLPDRWQALALAGLRAGRDVIVDAPTGAGKTYVFERWVEQSSSGKRALFTVPTRALANDKYAEWRSRGWRVGIMTGDLCVDPEAPVIVATLEAVQGSVVGARAAAQGPRSRAKDRGEPFHLLVIDEYHWIADPHRGNHYEGVLLSVPPELQLLLLSGAVANPGDVAAWLNRLGRNAEVVQHRERPVQLEEVDVDDLVHGLPRVIEGYWSKRVAGALREGLGPVLVFAPHRRDAERLARQFARELPLADPLTLTPEQEQLCGPTLSKMLRARVAYHHSGLSYAQRAGLIEPLAKAGQLRAVVATLGLSAGINFSLRSVLITASSYRHEQLDHEIAPHELLQMIGRAGRRGLDEAGFVLVSSGTPRMRRAEPLRLKRANALPWAFFLRQLRAGRDAAELAATEAARFFAEGRIALGADHTARLPLARLPCGELTDTGRARVVRRERNPFAGCNTCSLRSACLALTPQPTLLWQWQRTGVLDRQLRLTVRGEIVSAFLGPEGLALAAALENRRYPLDDLMFDAANLFAGERFCGTNPRWLGRLAAECTRAYRRLTIDGWLQEGLPVNYGSGASEAVRALVEQRARTREVLDAVETAGRGDLDRLLTEWRSLLRQAAAAGPLEGDGAPMTGRDQFIAERWEEFRLMARSWLDQTRHEALPELPPLTPDQRRPVNHSVLRARRPQPPGRAEPSRTLQTAAR